jgi:hypothetical protein
MFTYGLSDLLLLAVGSLVVFVLLEYILKVHVLISSEYKLSHIRNTCGYGKEIGKIEISLIVYCCFIENENIV